MLILISVKFKCKNNNLDTVFDELSKLSESIIVSIKEDEIYSEYNGFYDGEWSDKPLYDSILNKLRANGLIKCYSIGNMC